MTAAVFARLVESGRAAWGATLPDLFPDLAGAARAGRWTVTIDDVLAGATWSPTTAAGGCSRPRRRWPHGCSGMPDVPR